MYHPLGQLFDINAPAPESFGGDYNLVLASNALHTGDSIAGTWLLGLPNVSLLPGLMTSHKHRADWRMWHKLNCGNVQECFHRAHLLAFWYPMYSLRCRHK